MNLYGYPMDGECDEPLRLREVTFSTDAAMLRRLAAFFVYAAEQMNRFGENFGHEHFEDFNPSAAGQPSIVVTGQEGASQSA